MNTYDFVHLVLHAADGRIEGRTKLQKMVFFAGVLADCLEELGYRPHFYGPYSSNVAGSLDKLQSLNFLQQRVQGGGSVDSHGFEVARYDYELTVDGKVVAEEKANEHPKEWEKIQAAVKKLNEQGSIDYVKLSIAAKAYFLQQNSPHKLPSSDVKHFQKFGWDVSEKEIQDALNWLESVGLGEKQSAS